MMPKDAKRTFEGWLFEIDSLCGRGGRRFVHCRCHVPIWFNHGAGLRVPCIPGYPWFQTYHGVSQLCWVSTTATSARFPRGFLCMVKWRQGKSALDQGDAYTSSNEKHERIMNELTGVLWVPVERRPKIDQTAEAYQGFRHWMRNRMCPDCRPYENLPFIFLAA